MPNDYENDLHGFRELSQKLSKLDATLGKKVLRGSMMSATTKTVRKMKSLAPVGSKPHRTYKGRLVSPGFLSRSIKRVTRLKDGFASMRIGVRREAFYGIQFLDSRPGRTPYRITQRRVSRNGRSIISEHTRITRNGKIRTVRAHTQRKRGRRKTRVTPYTIRPKKWFSSVFEADASRIVRDHGRQVGNRIEKAVKL